jgi:hypothetical protein
LLGWAFSVGLNASVQAFVGRHVTLGCLPWPAWVRSYGCGVHKALGKSGAVPRPLAVYGLLAWLGENASTYKMLFWVALIPAVLSVMTLMFIKDQPAAQSERINMLETWKVLSPQFKRYSSRPPCFPWPISALVF